MEYREINELELLIIQVINQHRGSKNIIKRADMLKALVNGLKRHVSDRQMRQAIEDLRTDHPEGAYICSTTAGGYYRAESPGELADYLEVDERRAKMILARISRQRQRAIMAMTQAPLPMRIG